MPPRRRADKRRRRIDPFVFLFGDGVTPFLAGDETLENAFLARSAWDLARAETWSIDVRGISPPRGAVVYDGIGDRTVGLRRPKTLAELRETVAADIASVEAFREAEPAQALTIVDELDLYVEDLRLLLSVAEKTAPDEDGPLGPSYHDTWSSLEMRRRYSS